MTLFKCDWILEKAACGILHSKVFSAGGSSARKQRDLQNNEVKEEECSRFAHRPRQ